MTERLITIKERSEKTSTTGKPWLLVKDVNDQSFSCWEVKLFSLLQIGGTVNCRVETKGKYTNILDVLPDDGQAVHTKPAPSMTVKLFEKLQRIEDNQKTIIDLIKGLELVEPSQEEPPQEEVPF